MKYKNLFAALLHSFQPVLTKTCVETTDHREITYQDLLNRSAQFVQYFIHCGLQKGDRVLLQIEKSPEYLAVYLACLRSGIIFVPLDPDLSKYHVGIQKIRSVRYYTENVTPKLLLCDPQHFESLTTLHQGVEIKIATLGTQQDGTLIEKSCDLTTTFPSPEINLDDTACIIFTSGTTGNPKGVVLSNKNILNNAFALVDCWGFTEKDVLLHALPIYHAHGLFVAATTALLSTSKMIFLSKFDLDEFFKHLIHSTVFMGYPAFYTELLNDQRLNKAACKNMRLFTSGSASLLRRNFKLFSDRTGFSILERYGMSETIVTVSNPLHEERRIGTIGKALPGITLRLVDQYGKNVKNHEAGRLEVKGDSVFAEYWQLPEKTAESFTIDGFFKTGDLAKFDEKNYLIHMGREKDLVTINDEEICTREIELTINSIPNVLESAIVGIEKNSGETILAAAVVLENEHHDLTEKQIYEFLAKQLPNTKIPGLIKIQAALPRNPTGKIDKQKLTAELN